MVVVMAMGSASGVVYVSGGGRGSSICTGVGIVVM
jgi:hypothetical protein